MKSIAIGLILPSLALAVMLQGANPPQESFRHLVRSGTWTENWPDLSGKNETRTVTAEVWTQAFQADLDADGQLHIPAREKPYYLDAPLVMKSGQKLIADPQAEIRLKPGTNTCMVRNEHVIGFADRPVPAETNPDTGITIEGGIWTTLANEAKDNNGNRAAHRRSRIQCPARTV